MTRLRFLIVSLMAAVAAVIPWRRYTVEQWCEKHGLILDFSHQILTDGSLRSVVAFGARGYAPLMCGAVRMDPAEFERVTKRGLLGKWHEFRKIEAMDDSMPWGHVETRKVYFPADLIA